MSKMVMHKEMLCDNVESLLRVMVWGLLGNRKHPMHTIRVMLSDGTVLNQAAIEVETKDDNSTVVNLVLSREE